MSDPQFWVDAVPSAGSRFTLSGSEGRHAAGVTRLAVGERLRAADGRGTVAACAVVAVVGKDSLVAEVLRVQHIPHAIPVVTLVQALPKSERSELAVDLATEAGVDRIVPWQAARCVARWTQKAPKGVAKWRAVASAAAKQSRRPWLPEVTDLHTTTDVRARCADVLGAGGVVLVLHEQGTTPIADVDFAGVTEIVLVVGPEGGLDDAETADLIAVGAVSTLLGPQVLRTSTAAAVALGALGTLTGRWAPAPGAAS